MMKKLMITMLIACSMFQAHAAKPKKKQQAAVKKTYKVAPKAKKAALAAPAKKVNASPQNEVKNAQSTEQESPRWCPPAAAKGGGFSPTYVSGTTIYCFEEITDGDFDTYLHNVTKMSPSGVVVVDFNGEDWCFYSQAFKLIFDDTARLYPNVKFIKVHTDRKFKENRNTLMQYGIQGVPDSIFFKNGNENIRHASTNHKDFAKLLDCVISNKKPTTPSGFIDPNLPPDCNQVLSTETFKKNTPVDLSKQVLVPGLKKDITKF